MNDSRIIDVSNMLLKYAENTIYVIMEDDTDEPWFNGKDVAKFFGYADAKKSLRQHVSKKNIKKLKELVSEYKLLYSNVQGHSLYVNEKGFYELLSRSNMPDAKEIQKWLYTDVLPSFRRNGHYEIDQRIKTQLTETNKKYQDAKRKMIDIKNRNKELEHNQRKTKYPDGGAIYIKRPSITSDKNMNKIGKTNKSMKSRDSTYNTTVPDDTYTVIYIPVKDPDGAELCLRGLLNEFRYRNRKEYFKCSVKTILERLDACVFISEERHILDNLKETSRIKFLDDTKEKFKYENDMEEGTESDDEFDEDSDDENNEQEGGGIDFEQEYYKYRCKHLGLLLTLRSKKHTLYNNISFVDI